MADWYSQRFGKPVWLTKHARQRMLARQVTEELLVAVIEHGTILERDHQNVWIFQRTEDPLLGMVCAATVVGDALIIKTVMTHWRLEESL